MDLNLCDVILKPVVTDKAYKLNNTLKQLVLEVHPKSNKILVAKALEKLFEVKVSGVRIMVRKGKLKRDRKGRESVGVTKKRAIVTLKEGYTLDVLGQAEVSRGAPQGQSVDKSSEGS